MPKGPCGIEILRGETTVLGRVIELDESMLTVTIEVSSAEKTWKFPVSRELLRQLRTRLNKHVVLEGKAAWREPRSRVVNKCG